MWHDDELAAERASWRKRGGEGKSNRARARKSMPAVLSVDELRAVLSSAVARVFAGTMEPGPANALANLARAHAALTEAGKAEELVARLDALEAAAKRAGAA